MKRIWIILLCLLLIAQPVYAASSRKTATNENVSTYGVTCDGTCDYTEGELGNWEADTDVDLVTATQSEVLEIYDDAASYDDEIWLSGATANSSYFRIMRPASGEGHNGTPASGVYFASTSIPAVSGTFTNSDNYNQIQDLIVSLNINSASNYYCFYENGDQAAVVGCIATSSANVGTGGVWGFVGEGSPGETMTFANCLTTNHDGGSDLRVGFGTGCAGAATHYMLNCTTYAVGAYGYYVFNASAGSVTVITNGISDSAGVKDFYVADLDGTETFNYCTSLDVTADDYGGSGHQTEVSVDFVNAAGGDLHIDSTDTIAKDNGTDLSGTFDDDIDGDTRSGSWDIGFDEYVAAGPTIPVLMYHYQHH